MINNKMTRQSAKIFIQRAIVALYYIAAAAALYTIEWSHFSITSWLITFYMALWVADFSVGLFHLYVDYSALNFKKGFGRLYDYKDNRNTDFFDQLKQEVIESSTWFDRKVYAFKIHHRNWTSSKDKPYREVVLEFFAPPAIYIICALAISYFWGEHSIASHLAFFNVVFSFFVLHAQYVHYSMHRSNKLQLGNALVKFLRDYRLIYSFDTHVIHHTDGLTGFCFIAGHADFAVNWICKQLLKRGVINSDDWHARNPLHANNNV